MNCSDGPYIYTIDRNRMHLSSDLSIEQLRAIRRWIGAIPAITSKGQRVYLPRNEFEDELRWALVAAMKGNKNENA